MVFAMEVFRGELDPFFGLTAGWKLHDSDGLTRLPGEAVGFSGKVVFDADGYETPYELPESIPPTGGVWITCADLKTRLRFASHFAPKSASPTKRKRAPAAKTRPVSPKSNGTSNVGNGSTYTKQVCQVEFPSVTVEVLHWQETLLGHAQAYFELEVEVNGTKRWLKALKPSELVTEQHEFQLYRQRGELGITLQHIPNNPAISRVVQVDPTLSGYLQGVRVGDLLLNSSTLTFLRMQRRRIDFSKQLVDFDLETTARCPASLQLSMVRDSVTSEFPELDLLEQSFQMNKNKRTVLGQCQLDLFNPQQQPLAHYLQVDSINWEVKRRAVLPNQVCLTRLQFTCSSNNNNRARMFINLVAQEQDGKFDLALTSFHSPTVDLRKFADGSLQLEAKLGKLQLDDLQPNSPFPVVFTPTQFKLDHSLFLRLYLELGPGEDVVLLNLLDLMVGEMNIKMSSTFMSKLSQFSATTTNNNPPLTPPPPPAAPKRVHINKLDIKPMRMNVTFVNSANTSTNSSNRSLRASPVFMPLYSTLVSAFTSVSNAPLKFNALLLNNETKTTESLSFALKHYYINQVKRQLFSIAGSSDILGSPVQLLGGVSHGVFSFFYEPALALSMGGGEHIGAGLSRGSSAMVNNSAGSLLESLAKVTRAVARTLATSSGDHAFASWIDAQLNFEGFREPVNLIEGANRGALVLIKSLVDAVFAMFNSPHQVLRHFAGLLLKPASGFFGLLAQFSCGVRNTLVDGEEDALLLSIPVRLAKPRELTIVPYSASRCAGYMLASARYGKSAKLITSCVCQVEQIKGSVTLLTVAKLVLTDTWLAACREVDVDVFALPVECVERFEIQAANHQVTLSSLGRRYVFTCLKPVAMKQAWEQAFWLKTGKRASSSVATTTVQSLQRMVSFHKSEIDVSELRVRAATIQSFGAWEDGITRYHVLVVGSDDQSTWTVERRYREFLDFRDRACEALGVSRRCMPLPSRKAWVLGPREHEERKLGLQRLLDLVLTVDLLRESEVLREFVCRGAENVHLF